jgi:hypothetical protein
MNKIVTNLASDNQTEQSVIRKQLNNMAISGLAEMFDIEKNLFCFRVKKIDHGLVKEGISHRYTIISLLGLQQIESQGVSSPVSIPDALATLVESMRDIDNIGDVGLLLWLCSMASPQRLIQICSDLDIKNALVHYPDALERRTMELAWFLTGLSHTKLVLKDGIANLSDLAANTYNLLKSNYAGKGIFGHQSLTSFKGMIRGRIGSFADQVYPIYALSRYAQAFSNEEALKIALDCAKTICHLQGSMGQWWWHYDSLTGKVVGRYPVYAVHQDGMAPMALFAINEVSGQDFSKPIIKGLKWIAGNNELGYDLVDTSRNVIWRSIYRQKYKMYCDEALSLFGLNRGGKIFKDIKINFECRPYHLGWILYAFAGREVI